MGEGATPPRTQRTFGLAETGPGYHEFVPSSQLEPYVVCLWKREARSPDVFSRVVPDGCIDIIWMGDDRLVVAGPATWAIIAESQTDAGFVGVRFPPGIAPSLLDVPADALTDQHVPLDRMWPAESHCLLERAAGHATAELKLALLQALLLSKLADHGAMDEPVRAGVALLTQRAPPSIGELSDALLLSERQLHRRFRIAVGYGPKTLHRILRFQRALSFLRNPVQSLKLVDIAMASGYADQPHMVRDFVRLAGLPPARLAHPPGTSTSDLYKTRAVRFSDDQP